MKSSWRMIARFASISGLLFLIAPPLCMAQTGAPTVTTLTISPSASVSAGTVLSLTATVTSPGAVAGPGLVIFCNAAAAHCVDSAILGQARFPNGGKATLRLRLGVGSHSVKAIFQGTPGGTPALAGSTSDIQALTVTKATGSDATNTTVSTYGAAGNYTFVGTVLGLGHSAPTGKVSFLDTTNGDASLGTASLGATWMPGFSILPAPPAGRDFTVVAAADFDSDGIPDLASLSYPGSYSPDDGDLEIDQGNGDGTFQQVLEEPFYGNFPSGMRVEDFTNDGRPDIALLLTSTDGYDDSSLLVSGNYTYLGYIRELGPAADLNGDGFADLSFLSYDYDDSSYHLTLLLGHGDGTFALKSEPNISLVYPTAMVAGDVNGDGLEDLAIADQVENGVAILLNNGDGTFTALKSTPINSPYGDFRLLEKGDFNGDGILDLVTADVDTGNLTVLTGNGDGTFNAKSLPGLFSRPETLESLVVADFNGDGITDLAVTTLPGTVTILAGKGDGTFANVSATAVNAVEGAAFADFNGDGLTDLFIASPGTESESILLGGREARAGIGGVSLGPGDHTIVAKYEGDAHSSASDSAALKVTNTTGGPLLTPSAGTYTYTQRVTLSDQTPGALIYYTLDGTQPTNKSARYTEPIEVSWQATINAMAVLPGAANSAVTSGAYLIERPAPPPTFTRPAGSYSAPFTFGLANDSADCESGACVLYYSLNGQGFQQYTGPVTITQPATFRVKAFTTEWHHTSSPAAAVTYTITP